MMGRAFRAMLAALAASAIGAPIATVAAADDLPPKRALPDYDGRPDAPPTAGDDLLWLPRIVLFPLYLLSEYTLRAPLKVLVINAEKHNWSQALINVFTFNDQKAGFAPTILINFGFKPSVGAYFFYDDLFAKGNDLRLNVGVWTDHWLNLTAVDRVHTSKTGFLELRASYLRRPDYRFYGIGPDTGDTVGRYSATVVDAGMLGDLHLGRALHVTTSAGARRWTFRTSETCCDDPSVDQEVAAGVYAAPNAPDFTNAYERVEAIVDSRAPRPAAGSGIRARAFVEQDDELSAARGAWVQWGGDLGGSLDLTGHDRDLSLTASVRFTDPIRGPIPFVQLASIGGDDLLRGFYEGRARDRSATALTLQYNWPVWALIDGSAHFAVGDVFGEHLEGFEAKRLRWSTGLGLRSSNSRDSTIEAMIAVGSATFEQGGGIDSVRVVLGVNNGL